MSLYEELRAYAKNDYYPFHMPGHKRNEEWLQLGEPISYDITEITNFDNLHHAIGIIQKEQEYIADFYHAKESFFLVNGSSCGILSAISACVPNEKKLLCCRNVHKSVYNAAYIRDIELEYIMPKVNEIGMPLPIEVSQIKRALADFQDIGAVLITSPTYEGLCSDIEAIAKVVHEYHIPLIVDAAHGAHLGLFGYGIESPVKCGADITIVSTHKTLPCLTQTALLHLGQQSDLYVDCKKVKTFLSIYQTSSPSYVFMGSISNCFHKLKKSDFKQLYTGLEYFYEKCEKLKYIHLFHDKSLLTDITKLVIYSDKISGNTLFDILRDRYHLEFEMASLGYILGITTIADKEEGFERLYFALQEIDLEIENTKEDQEFFEMIREKASPYPKKRMSISQAMDAQKEKELLREAVGKISGEYIYCYPPGIPILVPGEEITQEMVRDVKLLVESGINVQGLEDKNNQSILTVKA